MKVEKSFYFDGWVPIEYKCGWPAYTASLEMDGVKHYFSKVYNEDSHSDELEERFKSEATEAFNRKMKGRVNE